MKITKNSIRATMKEVIEESEGDIKCKNCGHINKKQDVGVFCEKCGEPLFDEPLIDLDDLNEESPEILASASSKKDVVEESPEILASASSKPVEEAYGLYRGETQIESFVNKAAAKVRYKQLVEAGRDMNRVKFKLIEEGMTSEMSSLVKDLRLGTISDDEFIVKQQELATSGKVLDESGMTSEMSSLVKDLRLGVIEGDEFISKQSELEKAGKVLAEEAEDLFDVYVDRNGEVSKLNKKPMTHDEAKEMADSADNIESVESSEIVSVELLKAGYMPVGMVEEDDMQDWRDKKTAAFNKGHAKRLGVSVEDLPAKLKELDEKESAGVAANEADDLKAHKESTAAEKKRYDALSPEEKEAEETAEEKRLDSSRSRYFEKHGARRRASGNYSSPSA